MRNTFSIAVGTIIILSVILFSSCHKEIYVSNDEVTNTSTVGDGLPDWSTNSHSNAAYPNYNLIFDQNKVQRIDIVLTADEFQEMQDDLENLYGSTTGGGPGGGPGGGTVDTDENPIYVAADFYYNGIQWYEVGVRYKGNSSLRSAYNQGNKKLPLRFKFDKFEDDYPEISNQRFYGFKELSMSNGFNDQSFLREKCATDVFRAFGVPAPQTAYYEVWVDEGDGTPKYYGLYTMVEVVFDTMLDEMFGSSSGNCYKPDGEGSRFGSTGFTLDDFEKKTNEENGDWSDIQEMYDALHASTRTTDVEQWKSDLEAVFDVDGFLKYLAVNNTIQNWDTYGNMTHNYYLYHDPADGLLKWIPWDNNEAFTSSSMKSPLSFEMNEVSDDWPLITYIVDIPEYREIYDAYIKSFIEGPFEASTIGSNYSKWDNLIYNAATSEVDGYTYLTGSNSYSSAVSQMHSHASSRNAAANSYLN